MCARVALVEGMFNLGEGDELRLKGRIYSESDEESILSSSGAFWTSSPVPGVWPSWSSSSEKKMSPRSSAFRASADFACCSAVGLTALAAVLDEGRIVLAVFVGGGVVLMVCPLSGVPGELLLPTSDAVERRESLLEPLMAPFFLLRWKRVET